VTLASSERDGRGPGTSICSAASASGANFLIRDTRTLLSRRQPGRGVHGVLQRTDGGAAPVADHHHRDGGVPQKPRSTVSAPPVKQSTKGNQTLFTVVASDVDQDHVPFRRSVPTGACLRSGDNTNLLLDAGSTSGVYDVTSKQ